jgi:hypothetical protein
MGNQNSRIVNLTSTKSSSTIGAGTFRLGTPLSASLPPGHSLQSHPYAGQHPLLVPITTPVNRFWADFASTLVTDPPWTHFQDDTALQACALETIPGCTVTELLGSGKESVVYAGVQSDSDLRVAIKKLVSPRPEVPREVTISQSLSHPNCLRVLDAFQYGSSYFVIMPISTFGALNISTVPELTIRGAVTLLSQIGSALAHMHSQQIVHRDVKPGNILVFEENYVLCDFSISSQLSGDDELVSGIAGTPVFMAPEISVNMYAPKPADMWALGVTVYGLVYGAYPWTLARILEQKDGTLSEQKVAKNEVNGKLVFP